MIRPPRFFGTLLSNAPINGTFVRHFRSVCALSQLRPTDKTQGTMPETIADKTNEMFNYTSGRWLYNEALRMNERRLVFNFSELCKVIAKAVDRHIDDIQAVSKIAEGGSYRVFEATFQDDLRVIARLPFPSSRPKTLGIASEVATMQFLRLHGCPVPVVYEWSSNARANPVGAEYMIMEKARGTELQNIWYSMDIKQRMDTVGKIANFEKRLLELPLPAYGSIYFKDTEIIGDANKVDIVTEAAREKFCVGPSTEYLWWYQGRNRLSVQQGSWKSSKDVLEAVGKRELAWLEKHGKPRLPQEPFYRELYDYKQVKPHPQISALSDYLRIADYLVPGEVTLSAPILRHPDLSPNNIFISEAGEITSVIDWQHSVILPLFLSAKMPRHFQNYGDEESENNRPPKLPDNFEQLDGEQKEVQLEIYRRRQVHFFYLGCTGTENELLYNVMTSPDLIFRNQIYESASAPWEGDSISLKANLMKAVKNWEHIYDSESSEVAECPINYSEQETAQILDLDEKQKTAAANSQRLRNIVGVNIDGWVPKDDFDTAVSKATIMRAQMLEAAETEKERNQVDQNWPFDDYDESY